MILPKLLSQTDLGLPLLLSAFGVTISRCHFAFSTVLPLTAFTCTSINACGFSHWRPTRVPLRSMHLVASNWTPNEWCPNAGTPAPRRNTAVKTRGSFTLIEMSPFRDAWSEDTTPSYARGATGVSAAPVAHAAWRSRAATGPSRRTFLPFRCCNRDTLTCHGKDNHPCNPSLAGHVHGVSLRWRQRVQRWQ